MALQLHMLLKVVDEHHNGTLLFLDNQVYAMLHAGKPITQETIKKLWDLARKVTGDLKGVMDAFIVHYNEMLSAAEAVLHKRGISVSDYVHKSHNINDLVLDNHEWAKGLLGDLNWHYYQLLTFWKLFCASPEGDSKSNEAVEEFYNRNVKLSSRFVLRAFMHNYEERLERINRRLPLIPAMAVGTQNI